MGSNKICFEIDNCCDCPYHYKEKIYTADSWEHEMGVYCSNKKESKLVASDDCNVRKYSQIPDWCPLKVIISDNN